MRRIRPSAVTRLVTWMSGRHCERVSLRQASTESRTSVASSASPSSSASHVSTSEQPCRSSSRRCRTSPTRSSSGLSRVTFVGRGRDRMPSLPCWKRSRPRRRMTVRRQPGTSGTRWGQRRRLSTSRSSYGLVETATTGAARQMVVHALGRFTKASGVEETLLVLIDDPDVALHAMGALRRVVGAREALPHLERVARERRGTAVGEQAARQVKRARTSLSSKVHTVIP